jgi:hypothetical protein
LAAYSAVRVRCTTGGAATAAAAAAPRSLAAGGGGGGLRRCLASALAMVAWAPGRTHARNAVPVTQNSHAARPSAHHRRGACICIIRHRGEQGLQRPTPPPTYMGETAWAGRAGQRPRTAARATPPSFAAVE